MFLNFFKVTFITVTEFGLLNTQLKLIRDDGKIEIEQKYAGTVMCYNENNYDDWMLVVTNKSEETIEGNCLVTE